MGLPRKLRFGRARTPTFLLVNGTRRVTFGISMGSDVTVLSLGASSMRAIPSRTVGVALGPGTVGNGLEGNVGAANELDFRPSRVPAMFGSPVANEACRLIFGSRFSSKIVSALG